MIFENRSKRNAGNSDVVEQTQNPRNEETLLNPDLIISSHETTTIDEFTEEQIIIDKIVSTMSLNEKIGQLMLAGIDGTAIDSNTKSLINDYKVGGLILYAENMSDTRQVVTFLSHIKSANSTNRLPLFLGVDQEGGQVSRLPKEVAKIPTNKIIGKINNPQFSFEVGAMLGEQVKAFGFNMDFAPVLDINSNPNNPVIGNRSFGKDEVVVSALGIQTMKGIQSQNVISVVKHFPGHGDTAVDSHFDLPQVNKNIDELQDLELIPFKQSIENGADVIMVAHILLPKIDAKFPSSLSKSIITDLLRNKLGFDGVVMTDDMTMRAITKHFDIGQAAVESVKAGSDIIMVAHDYEKVKAAVNALRIAVQGGEITEDRINTSVKRVIQLKRNYEMNDEKVEDVDINKVNDEARKVLKEYVK
nr:beta-N-acetylhexosaminidase [Sporosarcina limicola]